MDPSTKYVHLFQLAMARNANRLFLQIYQSVAFVMILFFVSTLPSLPLSIYQTFVLEEKHGFNKTTPGLFVADLVKGWVVAFLIGGPFVAMFLSIVKWAGDRFVPWLMSFLSVSFDTVLQIVRSSTTLAGSYSKSPWSFYTRALSSRSLISCHLSQTVICGAESRDWPACSSSRSNICTRSMAPSEVRTAMHTSLVFPGLATLPVTFITDCLSRLFKTEKAHRHLRHTHQTEYARRGRGRPG
jgi:hypothetical protein